MIVVDNKFTDIFVVCHETETAYGGFNLATPNETYTEISKANAIVIKEGEALKALMSSRNAQVQIAKHLADTDAEAAKIIGLSVRQYARIKEKV